MDCGPKQCIVAQKELIKLLCIDGEIGYAVIRWFIAVSALPSILIISRDNHVILRGRVPQESMGLTAGRATTQQ
jgi:hypothetical protein